MPPFILLNGLGDAVVEDIIKARDTKAFTSVEDFKSRAPISKKNVEELAAMGVFKDIKESDQISLFDFSY